MKWTSLSLIFLMLSCQSMNLLMPQYLPTNTHQQVEASQQLHQGITDIQYQTGWDKIPTLSILFEAFLTGAAGIPVQRQSA